MAIAGQSAGAGSVSTHLVTRRSFGLFRAAAMMSGAFSTWVSGTLFDAAANYNALLRAVTPPCGDIHCLEKRSPEEVRVLRVCYVCATCAMCCASVCLCDWWQVSTSTVVLRNLKYQISV